LSKYHQQTSIPNPSPVVGKEKTGFALLARIPVPAELASALGALVEVFQRDTNVFGLGTFHVRHDDLEELGELSHDAICLVRKQDSIDGLSTRPAKGVGPHFQRDCTLPVVEELPYVSDKNHLFLSPPLIEDWNAASRLLVPHLEIPELPFLGHLVEELLGDGRVVLAVVAVTELLLETDGLHPGPTLAARADALEPEVPFGRLLHAHERQLPRLGSLRESIVARD